MTNSQKRLLFLSSLGGVLEFYDFIVFALLASYIAKEFFPTGNNLTALIATFATFSVGYLVRPLGGIIFGHYGDRHGRKTTFTISILLMAVATFAIGCVPAYSSIGIAAPIILTVLRILQGLSIGGEIPGAIAYINESIPKHKGLATGIIFFALLNGIVLGSLAHALLNSLLSLEQIISWGWRLPFLIGGIFGFLSYHLRLDLEESSLFKSIEHKVEAFPMIAVCKNHGMKITGGFIIVGLLSSIITLLFLFTPSYITKVLNQELGDYLWWQTGAMFLSAVLAIFFGYLMDIYKHKHLLLILAILSTVTAYPIFYIYTTHFNLAIIALLISAISAGYASGTIPCLLSDLFPTEVRYSGIAITYNIGFAVFGGLTPLIATTLIYLSGNVIAPVFYLLTTSILALVVTLFL